MLKHQALIFGHTQHYMYIYHYFEDEVTYSVSGNAAAMYITSCMISEGSFSVVGIFASRSSTIRKKIIMKTFTFQFYI